ncbi:aminodeoxychorismate synthase, component I [Endozoicomonas sp. (ex Bugula neritina AB1)]|nr:aminodeoxychorismate synthase, component I [Endozoicomonas sp. (ex Bugula neritina AB1)]
MKQLTIFQLEYQQDSSVYFEYFKALPYACFLDSCAENYDGNNSRFDIISAQPSVMVTVDHHGELLIDNFLDVPLPPISKDSPFDVLSELLASMSPVRSEELPFTGGTLGFWGYELCELLEPEKIVPRQNNTPMMSVGLYHWALITDHETQQCSLVFHPDIDAQLQQNILQQLDKLAPAEESFQLQKPFESTQSQQQYFDSFAAIQDYIQAGDCYEVNLTQEFTAPYSGCSWSAYKKLRQVSPAPYSAYLSNPHIDILSHSPERFIKVNDRHVETHPIKGTRPRGRTPEEDQAYANELLSSSKDKAENLMIVDLLRNDLGKVCETGSIQVPRLFALESYANVHHLVSSVTGTLPEHADVFSLFSNTFPGGSITGAPKIRSMEIIRELEPAPRSTYCGAIGYASCNGNMDTSITIRTIVAHNNRMHCWGGGAIVSDSDCREEYQESITKVKNLMTALESLTPFR